MFSKSTSVGLIPGWFISLLLHKTPMREEGVAGLVISVEVYSRLTGPVYVWRCSSVVHIVIIVVFLVCTVYIVEPTMYIMIVYIFLIILEVIQDHYGCT